MKIYVKSDDGTLYKALQINENTYTFRTEDETYELSLSESKQGIDFSTLPEGERKKITEAIFSNEDIVDQLRDAKKNRDRNFLYYSGDEKDFDKLVDEVNNDR